MRTVAAHDVAAELRRRLPGLAVKRLHKLLYYCQGHHLAVFDEPLFGEAISAWDMGPVVDSLWREERYGLAALDLDATPLTERALNTIGYVISRYGALTGTDLEHLTHSEAPWANADLRRRPGGSVVIAPADMRAYFRSSGVADEDSEITHAPGDDAVAEWLAGAEARQPYQGKPDSLDDLMHRLSELGA